MFLQIFRAGLQESSQSWGEKGLDLSPITREADQAPTLPLNQSGNVRLSEPGIASALVQKKSVCVFPTLPLSPDSLLLFFALEGSGGLVQLGHPKRTHTSLSCRASLLCLASKHSNIWHIEGFCGARVLVGTTDEAPSSPLQMRFAQREST